MRLPILASWFVKKTGKEYRRYKFQLNSNAEDSTLKRKAAQDSHSRIMVTPTRWGSPVTRFTLPTQNRSAAAFRLLDVGRELEAASILERSSRKLARNIDGTNFSSIRTRKTFTLPTQNRSAAAFRLLDVGHESLKRLLGLGRHDIGKNGNTDFIPQPSVCSK
jgi:hypothetical protein